MPHCGYCGERLTIGQAPLSRSEIKRLDLGGPGDNLNCITAQCIKGAADYYGVKDWISLLDSSLTYNENIGLIEAVGEPDTRYHGRPMTDGGGIFRYRCPDCDRWYPTLAIFLDHAEADHDRPRQSALSDCDMVRPADVPDGIDFSADLEQADGADQ